MKFLGIKHVSGVEKIGDSFISTLDTYDFKNLKYLSLVKCPDLVNIDIKC